MQTEEKQNKPRFSEYAILELFGQIRLCGLVTEIEIFGTTFGKIQIIDGDCRDIGIQIFGASSVFRLTPITLETLQDVAASYSDDWHIRSFDLEQHLRAEYEKTYGEQITALEEQVERMQRTQARAKSIEDVEIEHPESILADD